MAISSFTELANSKLNMSLLTDIETAVTEAWEDKHPVVSTAQREPNHVARLIGHVCQPIADSIVNNRIATAASVRATFCHQNPFAFWQNPGATGRDAVLKRELGDLLVIVRSPLCERALLLQTKMSGDDVLSPWQPGAKVSVSPDGQRDLYACLHPFHLQYTGVKDQPTASMARRAGSVAKLEAKYAAQHKPLFPYELTKVTSAAPLSMPPAMIFAWIDSTNVMGKRTRQSSPWSAWLTEPSQPIAGSERATLSSTFSASLESMICSPTPQVGRSIDRLGPYPEWARLICDLENWADNWFLASLRTKNHDVSTVSGVYDPTLYNSKGSAFMAWTSAGPYTELRKLSGMNRAWPYSRTLPIPIDGPRLRFIGPPTSRFDGDYDQPKGGFAVIEIRLTSTTFFGG